MRTWRIAIYAAITVFWLVMMGLLVRDHLLPDKTKSDLLEIGGILQSQEWKDYEEWMTLNLWGKPRGVSYTTVRKQASGLGYLVCNRIRLELGPLGGGNLFRLETVALLDSQFNLERARATVRFLDSEMLFLTLVTQRKIQYRWQLGDQVRVGSQDLERPISLLEALRPLVAQRLELEVGKVYRLPVLDSTWSLNRGMAQVRVEALERIKIGGKPVEAYRVVTQLGTLASTAWVSPKGEVLRRRFANFLMERTDPASARERYGGIDADIEAPPIRPTDFESPPGVKSSAKQEVGPLNLLIDLLRQSSQHAR